jgi:hypothetical protein
VENKNFVVIDGHYNRVLIFKENLENQAWAQILCATFMATAVKLGRKVARLFFPPRQINVQRSADGATYD